MATDGYENADERAKQQGLALMQAIAEAGTDGKAAYQHAAQAANENRLAAVREATGRVTGVMGPDGLVAQLRSQAGAPADARLADNAQAQGIFSRDIARQQQANGDYMSQVRAAIPLVRQRTQAEVAGIQAQQEEAARDRAVQREIARMQQETEQTRLATEQETLKQTKDGTKPKTTAEQKYEQQQEQSQAQKIVLAHLESGASDGTKSAFYDAIAKGKTLEGALSIVGTPGAAAKMKAAGINPASLRDWITRYFHADAGEIEAEIARQKHATPPQGSGGVGFGYGHAV
jgi:hypothetical protein